MHQHFIPVSVYYYYIVCYYYYYYIFLECRVRLLITVTKLKK